MKSLCHDLGAGWWPQRKPATRKQQEHTGDGRRLCNFQAHLPVIHFLQQGCLLSLPKQHHQLGLKSSNAQEYLGHLIQTTTFYSATPRLSRPCHNAKCIQFNLNIPHCLSIKTVLKFKDGNFLRLKEIS